MVLIFFRRTSDYTSLSGDWQELSDHLEIETLRFYLLQGKNMA